MRFWEIDFARGLSLIAMAAYNWLYALGFFGLISFDANSPFWWASARLIAGAFVFIAGVSFYLARAQGKTEREMLKRGAKIFCLGLLITAATWFFVPEEFVVFGILHLIGASMILALLFERFSMLKLAFLGALGICLGAVALGFSAQTPWLLLFGVVPEGFQTLDYFPLLPWFGVFLLGIAFAEKYYAGDKRHFAFSENQHCKWLCFAGRHSLAVYLLHIPVLLVLLYLTGFDFLQGLKNA